MVERPYQKLRCQDLNYDHPRIAASLETLSSPENALNLLLHMATHVLAANSGVPRGGLTSANKGTFHGKALREVAVKRLDLLMVGNRKRGSPPAQLNSA